jgi:hypothetical protein
MRGTVRADMDMEVDCLARFFSDELAAGLNIDEEVDGERRSLAKIDARENLSTLITRLCDAL